LENEKKMKTCEEGRGKKGQISNRRLKGKSLDWNIKGTRLERQ